ncbi:unnamed protein product [Rotaria sordida]|uniref:Uncharacterized protein n=1 Tax=Rotaria sordida TaxID=392033 RepID=A0A819H3C9_9BILA|nr:unnamed protein product [Rotaria sordida]CAF3896988.1 unnamed protein product [Rotaria sordida]
MLATAHGSNRYTKSRMFENKWMDNDNNKRISWLNYVTIQTIPEETDTIDCPIRNYNDSDSDNDSFSSSLSSSMEDCYVVFEVQRSRSIDETKDIIEEQLNFAQINDDEHHIEYDQMAQLILIEMPLKEHAIERRTESIATTQLSNNILIDKPKIFDKSISVSHNCIKLKTIEHHSLSMSSKTICEQQSINHSYSIESLDSIENDLSKQPRIFTTFAHLSLQRKPKPIHIQHEKSTMETRTLTRRFAFDHIYTDKCTRVNNEKIINIEINNKDETIRPFYLNNTLNNNNNNNNNINNYSSMSNSVTKTSPSLRLLKNRSRTVRSECRLPDNGIKPTESSLFRVKYLDGRHTLADRHTRESLEKSQFLSGSISSRTSLSKIFSPDDIPTNSSLRKRIVHRFQNFFKFNSTEKSRPWQHKTIFELFNERKTKTDRH